MHLIWMIYIIRDIYLIIIIVNILGHLPYLKTNQAKRKSLPINMG